MLPVYQLNDLQAPHLQSGGKTVRLGVLGNPIAHSKSPQMQQAALDAAQLPHTYIRILAETENAGFENTVQHLRALGFIGANVTIPFKKRALQLADSADALATLCGAANTLCFKDGLCHAANTDGPGFARAILDMSGRPLNELRVAILGACGGAGSALAAQCALANCPTLTLINRLRPELPQLRSTLSPHSSGQITTCSYGDNTLQHAIAEADLIVNATSLGLRPGDAMPLPPEWLHRDQFVYDIVTHDTPFCHQATARGCTTEHGLSMLLWQGAYAFEHWFGFLPDVAAMRQALLSC